MNVLSKEGHVVEEINGVRCSVVEKNCTAERAKFLKKLLEHNGFTVIVAATPTKPLPNPPLQGGESKAPPLGGVGEAFTVGVTDISFHAMLAVYERSLFSPEGKIISIAYWNQQTESEGEGYWLRRKKYTHAK